MDLLILPGNSPGNRMWTNSISDQFLHEFDDVRIIEYESWKTNDYNKIIDLDVELEKIKKAVSTMESYYVFAKSVGTALCIKAVSEGIINPQKCVFVGMPLDWLRKNNIPISKWAGDYCVPTMVIQQEHDPYGNAETVRNFLQTIDNVKKYLVVKGDDHKYSDINTLISKSIKFFQGR